MSENGVTPPGSPTPEKEPEQVPQTPPAASEPPAEAAAPEPSAKAPVPEPAAEAAAPDPAPDTAQALIKEYQTVARWNSLVRVVFPVFVLALISVFLVVTALGIASAFPERRITQETVKAGEELVPILNNVLRSFVDDVAPQLADEFKRGMEEGGERLAMTMAQEIERLESTSGERIKGKVHTALGNEMKHHKALLLELYPDLGNDPERLDKLSRRLNKAFEMWTVQYMLAILEDYYLAMAKINDTVTKSFRPAPSEGAAPVREAELLELFMELTNAAYTDGGEQPVAPKAQAPAKTPAPEATPEAPEAPVAGEAAAADASGQPTTTAKQ